eukprot:16494-Heterococcus_DN1.PRE.1
MAFKSHGLSMCTVAVRSSASLRLHCKANTPCTTSWLLSLRAGAASSNVRHDTRASVGVRSLQERSASSSASAHTNVAESALQP